MTRRQKWLVYTTEEHEGTYALLKLHFMRGVRCDAAVQLRKARQEGSPDIEYWQAKSDACRYYYDTGFISREKFTIRFLAGVGGRDCFGEHVQASEWHSPKVDHAELGWAVARAIGVLAGLRYGVTPNDVIDALKAVHVRYHNGASEFVDDEEATIPVSPREAARCREERDAG